MIDQVKSYVWHMADELDWQHLTISERKKYYEKWTHDPNVGGILEQKMPPSRIRVYLKDTIMKEYARHKMASLKSLLNLTVGEYDTIRTFSKPQSLLIRNNEGIRLYTLTIAKEWKNSLLISFERGHETATTSNNLMIIDHTYSRFIDRSYREIIELAAHKLLITVHWID